MLADEKARKGKASQYGIKIHDKNRAGNLLHLQQLLLNKEYRTSPYTVFKIHEPKEREIYRLPYYPDRITHHAVINVLEPLFISIFTKDTYSCIKRRGIHAAANGVKKALRKEQKTKYCLKLDIKKFYPSIDHAIMKELLCWKIKDRDTLWLLNEIIDSAPGLPIGNYLSQYLANYYLTFFDHWIKESKRVKHYFRYADDIVILFYDKAQLHKLLYEIKTYLLGHLNLTVKGNYQVFPVSARGIDFVGYVFYHTHTRLRKSIKKSFARKISQGVKRGTLASYNGWAKHCNSKNLVRKLMNEKL